MSQEITDLLTQIQSSWSSSNCLQAKQASHLLTQAMQAGELQDNDLLEAQCDAPDLGERDENEEDIMQLIRNVNKSLPWKTPEYLCKDVLRPLGGVKPITLEKERVKTAMLVGPKGYGAKYHSDKIALGLEYMSAGTQYPQHQHHAAEVVQAVWGTSSWGPSPKDLEPLAPGNFLYRVPAEPHAVYTPEDQPLLYLYAWTGNIKGNYWFSNPEVGELYGGDFKDFSNTHGHAGDYYDKIAHNYEGILRGWGWNMPEAVVDGLEHVESNLSGQSVLDLGCGVGLVGLALKARGVTDIIGVDYSPNMLARAAAQGCYFSTQRCDLLDPLPLPSNNWDIVICSGVSTYLNPGVLAEWLRMTKVGGLVAFSHKNTELGKYEKEQDAMEERGEWERMYISENLLYLPTLRDPKEDFAKVYVYRKK